MAESPELLAAIKTMMTEVVKDNNSELLAHFNKSVDERIAKKFEECQQLLAGQLATITARLSALEASSLQAATSPPRRPRSLLHRCRM